LAVQVHRPRLETEHLHVRSLGMFCHCGGKHG
jgi:hypothetical protein